MIAGYPCLGVILSFGVAESEGKNKTLLLLVTVSLGGEDSYVRVYDKNYPNYIAIAKLSQRSYETIINPVFTTLKTIASENAKC